MQVQFVLIHLIVLLITIDCLLMNGAMRGGLPLGNTLGQRLDFIGHNSTLWTLSWCLWMLAALGLLSFCTIFADLLKPTFARHLGLMLVAAGIVPDLTAEVIYAFIIPKTLAQPPDMATLQLLETTAAHLTGFLGNGLYNLGALVLTLVAIQQNLLRPWIATWGLVSWILGLSLSAAIALDAMQAAEFFTATSMVLSTAWMLIIAYKVLPK